MHFSISSSTMPEISIRVIKQEDATWIKPFIDEHWGGEPLVIRDSKKYYPSSLSLNGIVAEREQHIVGILFYEITDQGCEIILLEVFHKFQGIGTALLKQLQEIAKHNNCHRIYVMTTNDSLDALRFYQRKGFTIYEIRVNAVAQARAIKPTIGLVGEYGMEFRYGMRLIWRWWYNVPLPYSSHSAIAEWLASSNLDESPFG